MRNSKLYYRLSENRTEIDKKLIVLENKIEDLRTEARRFKRGSTERRSLMVDIEDIKNSREYIELSTQIKDIDRFINLLYIYDGWN